MRRPPRLPIVQSVSQSVGSTIAFYFIYLFVLPFIGHTDYAYTDKSTKVI